MTDTCSSVPDARAAVAMSHRAGVMSAHRAGSADRAGVDKSAAPRDEHACIGSSVSFSVPETGPDVRYQWIKDGQEIIGATGRTLIFPAVAGEDAGVYAVSVVAGGSGSSVATVARLDIVPGPSIVRQPEDRAVAIGGSVIFDVETAGAGAMYQWRRDGEAIPGATNRSYIISAATAADAGSYSVIVSAPDCIFGGSESRAATLRVVGDESMRSVEALGQPVEIGSVAVEATATVSDDVALLSQSQRNVRAIGISPNPTRGPALLQLADGARGHLSVFEPTGQLMFERDEQPTQEGVLAIDTESLTDGIYFCRFVDADGTESVGRLVLVR